MFDSSSASALESFQLLAKGTKGVAAVHLVQQALEAPGVYFFGELLDHPNITSLENTDYGGTSFRLLKIFAFGTYGDYLEEESSLPPLTDAMRKKLRLLTIATMATKMKHLSYASLQKELGVTSIRELEDLIIEGCNNNLLSGKLDQKLLRFEVEYTMARDIKKSELSDIIVTINLWLDNCKEVLTSLQSQAARANDAKASQMDHKALIEQKINETRSQIKKQQQQATDAIDDPDSRMDERRKSARARGTSSRKAPFWNK